jgi:pyruvate,orthophosphate dikinase
VTHVFDCDERLDDMTFAEITSLLGGKAANLSVMAADLGLPVPPAFTISTHTCNEYLAHGWPDGLDEELREHMARMERVVGHRFGDASDPLLVSVRSGAPVSMPGMMDTILNLGLNDATTAGLAERSSSPRFAANCRKRFEAMYRDIVGVTDVPADPWVQLRGAIEAVFRSWNSSRARTYREREGIPDDLGTAVTVQAMVFGNRSVDSGTGVLFTRNPATGAPAPYGDFMFNAQGEDVVAGTHQTEPLAVLEERMPAVGAQLRANAMLLERHNADLCDIEFTIEHGRLWMLQCRVGKRSPQAALRIALDMADDPDFPVTREEAVRRVAAILANPPTTAVGREGTAVRLTTGLPASPGVAAGEVVTTPEAAIEAADAGRHVILVRAETSPDDVHGMARAAGILTSSGGLASHAAVVARGWGIPAVVGAAEVAVAADHVEIAGRRVDVGDPLTIDGATGDVFAGAVAGRVEVVPEAATLMGWAREIGIEIGGVAAETAVPGAAASEARASEEAVSDEMAPAREVATAPTGPTAPNAPDTDPLGAAVRALAIKGYASPDALATAIGTSQEHSVQLLDRLTADGLAEAAAGSFRLTDSGKAVAVDRLSEDTAAWGVARALAALDAFLAMDERMKATVTAWQMREIDGEQVFNDHADAAYDVSVMADLGALHADAGPWLDGLGDGPSRLRIYRTRLDRANEAAQGGDGRYVASPRVDSYHSVWFELHEDLIRLAGRNRADEVAAGRA